MRAMLSLVLSLTAGAVAAGEALVATRLVRPATVLSAADVATAATSVAGALPAGSDVAGLEARVTLYPGRPIMAGDVGPAALVERNQIVRLVYRAGGLTISAEGRALDRAAAGETVRVMNLASRSTVFGRVDERATVHVGVGAGDW